jgi:hypothetical protein
MGPAFRRVGFDRERLSRKRIDRGRNFRLGNHSRQRD